MFNPFSRKPDTSFNPSDVLTVKNVPEEYTDPVLIQKEIDRLRAEATDPYTSDITEQLITTLSNTITLLGEGGKVGHLLINRHTQQKSLEAKIAAREKKHLEELQKKALEEKDEEKVKEIVKLQQEA